MNYSMKSTFAIAVTALACLMLLYFAYGLFWFVLVGRRNQQHRGNVLTSIGFGAVILAAGLWALVANAIFQSAFLLEKLVLFTSVGLCVIAMVMAKFGSVRTAVPIMAGALVVALNSIGTVYAQ